MLSESTELGHLDNYMYVIPSVFVNVTCVKDTLQKRYFEPWLFLQVIWSYLCHFQCHLCLFSPVTWFILGSFNFDLPIVHIMSKNDNFFSENTIWFSLDLQ